MLQLTRHTGRERRYPVHKDVFRLPSMASGLLTASLRFGLRPAPGTSKFAPGELVRHSLPERRF
ncbi:MAG: hypothetical protein PHY16_04570 [Methylobacter sp.]|nr:hypothetical protein [Methylobacter sp.]